MLAKNIFFLVVGGLFCFLIVNGIKSAKWSAD